MSDLRPDRFEELPRTRYVGIGPGAEFEAYPADEDGSLEFWLPIHRIEETP